MSDDRTELLRTQAMQHVMSALGAAQVTVYGNEAMAGGVFLVDENSVTSRTYWTVDGTKYEYSVDVCVLVTRREVPGGR